MDISNLSKYVTTVAAFIGMGFGLYNFYIAKSNRKVKLKIVPKSVIQKVYNSQTGKEGTINSINDFNEATDYFIIEVVNMSYFPVTVEQVGFKLKDRPGNLTVLQPIIKDSGSWPRKLAPREGVSLYCSLTFLLDAPQSINIKKAFAETTCGTTRTGTSKALKKLVKFIKDERKFS